MTSARFVDLPARVLLSALFLVSGVGKLGAIAATQGYMAHYGVPGVLVWPAAAFEIVSGLMLLAGFWLRPLGLILAAWSLATALVFHTAFGDQMQLVNFLKNMGLAGGFLLLAKDGAQAHSFDGRRRGR